MDDLRKLQLVELDILNEFVRVCEYNHLTYYLSYGTLLGAIRHNGFIPWDDDVDVSMPRNDFDKFCTVCYKQLNGRFCFESFELNENYKSIVPRIIDKNYIIEKKNGSKTYVWIDIFPIDGISNNVIKNKFHKIKLSLAMVTLNMSRIGLGIKYDNESKSKKTRFAIRVIEVFRLGKLFNFKKRFCNLNKLLREYSFNDSSLTINFLGEKFKDECEKSFYGAGEKHLFEGYEFVIPSNYNDILVKLYRDYMKLPPQNQRNIHNFSKLVMTDRGMCSEFKNE